MARPSGRRAPSDPMVPAACAGRFRGTTKLLVAGFMTKTTHAHQELRVFTHPSAIDLSGEAPSRTHTIPLLRGLPPLPGIEGELATGPARFELPQH
jgi:hypothetical protein